MSYAGLGQALPGETVGLDHSGARHASGGSVRVGARWAQRAVNAGNRYNNSSAPLIGVDGHAGPITIAGLRTLSHQFASDQPATNDPATTRVTDTVIIPLALETALASKALIPDPPLTTATHHTTTSPTTGTPVTAPIPGAPPVAPADQVILDEGSSGGGGLIARWGIWPWAIGGAALVGVGIWFMSGGGMRANRRRVRRNSSRSLSAIASEIRREWKNPYFGAVPYIQAMGTLGSVGDNYGADRGDTIVAYFLSNASGWRGPAAKRIKAELNAALRGR